jgi:hypothetical protein
LGENLEQPIAAGRGVVDRQARGIALTVMPVLAAAQVTPVVAESTVRHDRRGRQLAMPYFANTTGALAMIPARRPAIFAPPLGHRRAKAPPKDDCGIGGNSGGSLE